jgi:4-amino-4-deoxy-L-arabinose transferase-like glycosyltransferase
MLGKIGAWINGYTRYLGRIVSKRDWSSILDQLLIFSLVFGIVFVGVYRVATYVESNYIGTTNIRLPLGIRHNLPFAYFMFLSFWVGLKYFFRENYEKTKKEFTVKREPSKTSFSLLGRKIEMRTTWLFGILVAAVILGSVLIKMPYWDLPFVGSHPIKYNTYAEPAQHMEEMNDPLYFKRHYMYDPIRGTQESAQFFGNFPLLEWCLYAAYSLLGNSFSIEFMTRLVMAVWGGIALLSLYVFTMKISNRVIALTTVVLLALNSIFNMASYVTVYDMLTFSAAFFSLSLLADWLKAERNPHRYLALAGLFVGIGSSVKINIAIWALPVTFVLVMLDRKGTFSEKLGQFMYYLLWFIAPLLVTYTSLAWFPSKETHFFVGFILSVGLLLFAYFRGKELFAFISRKTTAIVEWIDTHRFIYLPLLILTLAGIHLFYQTYIAKEFLTDINLLINFELYNRLVSVQLMPYASVFTSLVFFFTVPLVIRLKDAALRKYLAALLVGSLVYFVFAAKPLFFHSYYWLVLLATIYIFVVVAVFKAGEEIVKSKFIRNIFIAAFIGILAVFLAYGSVSKINRDDPYINKVAEYFNTLVDDNKTTYIDQAVTNHIIFKTKLNTMYSYAVFDTDEFREKVQELGFVGAMKHFKILYLVTTTKATPDYLPIANGLDFKGELEPYALRRTAKIEDFLYGTTNYYPDNLRRLELLKEFEVVESFELVKQIGNYDIYRVCSECDTSEEL